MSVVLIVFFVFKKTTAYEVRISDWSSDVCSSDLGVFLLDRAKGRGRSEERLDAMICNDAPIGARIGRADRLAFKEDRRAAMQQRRIEDRKSVVSGQSVSVSVDFGGRGYLNKKKEVDRATSSTVQYTLNKSQ